MIPLCKLLHGRCIENVAPSVALYPVPPVRVHEPDPVQLLPSNNEQCSAGIFYLRSKQKTLRQVCLPNADRRRTPMSASMRQFPMNRLGSKRLLRFVLLSFVAELGISFRLKALGLAR